MCLILSTLITISQCIFNNQFNDNGFGLVTIDIHVQKYGLKASLLFEFDVWSEKKSGGCGAGEMTSL